MLIARIIFLLNSFFLPLFAFEALYSLNTKNFEIIEYKDSYKLILKNQKFLDYKKIEGFKFFIPFFTKEFNLKVLRFNSIGYINGLLSTDIQFKNFIHSSDIKYYLTDYKAEGRELSFLLKGYTIPYYKQTSLSIEAYHIPLEIQKKLNKYFYFKKIPLKNNKLQYILYSFYIILDKKNVDNYIKEHYPSSKNYINTFINNVYNINLNKTRKKTIKKQEKKITKHKKISFHLILTRIHQMKTYGFIYQPPEKNSENEEFFNKILKINNMLEELKMNIYNTFNKVVNLSAEKKTNKIGNFIDKISKEIENIPTIQKENKCIFNPKKIDKKCFKNPVYFHNYIHFQIKKQNLPKTEDIIAYGDYKTFNDVGVYFYNQGDLNKAEIFLNKAYILADNKTIPSHNLSVLYFTKSPLFNLKKAIEYLKKSDLSIDYYNLGVYYYMGVGVKENDFLARKYFEKAGNIPLAKENLKIMNKYKIGLK